MFHYYDRNKLLYSLIREWNIFGKNGIIIFYYNYLSKLWATLLRGLSSKTNKRNIVYHCTSDYECPEDYPYLIRRKNECSKNIDIIGIIEELGKNDTVLKYIEQYLTSEYYDTSSIDLGQDETFNIKEITYTISTISNQKQNNNTTTINLGLCESYLINTYNLNNKTLYIKLLFDSTLDIKLIF